MTERLGLDSCPLVSVAPLAPANSLLASTQVSMLVPINPAPKIYEIRMRKKTMICNHFRCPLLQLVPFQGPPRVPSFRPVGLPEGSGMGLKGLKLWYRGFLKCGYPKMDGL